MTKLLLNQRLNTLERKLGNSPGNNKVYLLEPQGPKFAVTDLSVNQKLGLYSKKEFDEKFICSNTSRVVLIIDDIPESDTK